MNFRTTLLLLVLAAGGGAAYWYRDTIAARLGYAPRAADATPDTLYILRRIRPETITRVEVARDGDAVELVREGKAWNLPGGWPTRGPEVQELIGLLTGLDSRFDPIPVGSGADLRPYGLDKSQKPVEVTLTVALSGPEKSRQFRLIFGEPPGREGNPFTKPTYFRLEGQDQVLQSAPGLLLVLSRSKDDYRKRQLFPDVERVRVGEPRPSFPGEPDAPQPAAALLDARRVSVAGPDGAWTIRHAPAAAPRKPGAELPPERLAEEWALAEPVTDRVDPDKLRAALAAVPELWVENFVTGVGLADAGLDKPERRLTVESDKRTVELVLGKVSREVEKKAPPPPPNPFGAPPPPPQPVKETYRYAKLAGNPQVFEVKADKLGDLFVAPAGLRDPRVVRFHPADARRVEVARPDAQITLADERDETAKEDRWKLVQPMAADADGAKVTELLDRVGELRATGPDLIDKADPKAYGLDPAVPGTRLTVELSEEAAGGDDKARRPRTVTLRIGRHDTDKNKVYVQVAGNPRINAVADDFLKLFDRPALAYRGRRVIDVAADKVAAITVQRPGERYKLEQADGKWKLEPPGADATRLAVAEASKASTLVGDLSRLEAVEYVADAPSPQDLAKYGLSAPTLSVTLTFTDPSRPPKTVQVGGPRQGKPEVYAKLADAPGVFAVRESIKTTLDQPSLAYRPLQLWQLAPEAVTAVEVQRGGEKYRLSREGNSWKLTGPFDATASAQAALALVNQVAAPRAERYEAHTASDAAKYGFDKPEVRVTVFAEGGPKSLTIGKPAAADVKSRFARPADGDAVVVVPEALAKAADRPALDLIDPELLSLNANLISAARGAGPEGAWELRQDNGEWKVASLNPPAAADRLVVQGLLRPWADLRAERFAAYGPQTDWAKYGLDRSATTVAVTVTGSNETHTLALGKPAEGADGRYARLDDRPGVAVLPAAVTRDLTRSPLDLVDRTLFTFDPSELVAIRRTGPAGPLELTRAKDGWQVTKPSAHKADQPGLEELAERLGGLRAAHVAALDAKDLTRYGLDRPAAVVTLVLKDKDGKQTEHVVQVGAAVAPASGGRQPPGSAEERYGRVDGQGTVVVLPAAVAKALSADPIKFRDRTVARFAEADRIFVERGQRRVIFAKLDGTWKMTEPTTVEAESAELDDLVTAASRLRADELVAEKPADLKPYGLDKPEVRWRFLAGDREVLNLLVGKRDPGDPRAGTPGRNYAKLANGDVVFFLSPDLSNRLLAEHRKRTLWSGLDAAGVETLVYSVGEQTLVLQKVNDAWQVPGRPDQAVNAAAVNDVVSALAGLKVERYAADKDADLKRYGLQPPQRTVVARSRTGVTATLYLGKSEDGSRRVYARVLDPNRSDVFVLSEADGARLVKDLKALTK